MVENLMKSFFGTYPVTINDNNLLWLPKKTRRILDLDPVLVIGKEGYLGVYPREIYEIEREKMLAGRAERDIYYCHFDIKLLGNRCIYIPKLLRNFLRIGNEAVIYSIGKGIELWPREKWLTERKEDELLLKEVSR